MWSDPPCPAEIPLCPSCGSDRVAPGAIRGNGGPGLGFSLLELEISPWKFIPSYPSLVVEQPVWLCVACGLLWSSSLDLAEARQQIREYGSAALKERTLRPGDALPRPAAAPGADERPFPLPSHPGRPQTSE